MGMKRRPIPESKVCEVCGESFGRRDGDRAINFRPRRTCSKECWRRLSGRMKTAGMAETAAKACEACGESLSRRGAEAIGNYRNRKTCGRSCGARMGNAGRDKTKVPKSKHCEYCAIEFRIRENEPAGKYLARRTCGVRACRHGVMVKDRFGKMPLPVGFEKECESCGAKFSRRQGERASSFRKRVSCGNECHIKIQIQRQSKTVDIFGVILTYVEIAELTGRHFATIRLRIAQGLSPIQPGDPGPSPIKT